jgi:hypothetical protein
MESRNIRSIRWRAQMFARRWWPRRSTVGSIPSRSVNAW